MKRKRALVEEYIKAMMWEKITDSMVKAFCAHKWQPHGLGYICEKCSFYTGTNDMLNKAIVKELPIKKVVNCGKA